MSKELGRRENGKKENKVNSKKEKESKNKMKRMLIMRFENMMRHKTISPIKYIPNCWKKNSWMKLITNMHLSLAYGLYVPSDFFLGAKFCNGNFHIFFISSPIHGGIFELLD